MRAAQSSRPRLLRPTGERGGVGVGKVGPQAFRGWHRWLHHLCCGIRQECGQINCQWHAAGFWWVGGVIIGFFTNFLLTRGQNPSE